MFMIYINSRKGLTRVRSANCHTCRFNGVAYSHWSHLESHYPTGKNAFELIEREATSGCNYAQMLLNGLKVLGITTRSADSLVGTNQGVITVQRNVPAETKPPVETFSLVTPLGMRSTISLREATVILLLCLLPMSS
jgi:hypothetical protein